MAPRSTTKPDPPAQPRAATVTQAQAAQAAKPPTTAELAIRRNSELAGTRLELVSGQDMFSAAQLASLRQLGVDKATTADLMVYFHVIQRTGLDPFARQIYMINRKDKHSPTGFRQTIQTGIDGYRKIGHEAADQAGDTIGFEDTTWYDSDGHGYPVWLGKSHPSACRVVIRKNGQPFPGVVLWAEIAGTDYDGNPVQQWKAQGAHMLEKCAEAFAWRRAYPQRFQGVYTSEELGSDDDQQQAPRPSRQRTQVPRVARNTTTDWGNWTEAGDPPPAPPPPADDSEPVQGTVVGEPGEPAASERPKSSRVRGEQRMHALFRELGLGGKADSADRRGVAAMFGRERTTDSPLLLDRTSDLADDELDRLIGHLDSVKQGMEASEAADAKEQVTAALRTLAQQARDALQSDADA